MRRNLKNDFEAMYLRENMVREHINEADQSLLHDPQFTKSISYMSSKYFYRYREFFIANGFDEDDVKSIVMIFGLTYWGHVKPEAKDQKAFTFMMRYIGQRMQTMVRWTAKKFNSDELVAIVPLNDVHVSVYATDDVEDTGVIEPEESSSAKKLLNQRRQRGMSCNIDTELMAQDNTAAKKQAIQKAKDNRALSKILKKRLISNPLKYSDKLCYYATSKHVASDIRTKARFLCKKYGIDYLGWLKKQAENPNFTASQYTF